MLCMHNIALGEYIYTSSAYLNPSQGHLLGSMLIEFCAYPLGRDFIVAPSQNREAFIYPTHGDRSR